MTERVRTIENREYQTEFERKYLVRDLPDDYFTSSFFLIEQSYLTIEATGNTRVRQITDMNGNVSWYFTSKFDAEGHTWEHEVPISYGQYEGYYRNRLGMTILKKRTHIIRRGLIIEVDEFDFGNEYLPLFTAEVEFENKKQRQKFEDRLPVWLLPMSSDLRHDCKNTTIALHGPPSWLKH
jgi:CYTH domain-containing protein